MLLRHRGAIGSVIFSRDGKLLYTSELVSRFGFEPTRTGVIRVWDPTTGKLVRCLAGQPFGSAHLSLSPDGKLLASQSSGALLWVWNLAKRETVWRIGQNDWRKNQLFPLVCATFSPDGKELATIGHDSPIRLWEVLTGKPRKRFSNQKGGWSIVYCRGGKALACAGKEGLQLINVGTEKVQWRVPSPRSWFRSLALSPDGKVMAAGGGDGSISLVAVESGKVIRQWQAHRSGFVSHWRSVHAVAFSPDGNILASGGDDAVIRLWDPVTGKELRPLIGHEHSVCCVAFSPDGKTLASGSLDRMVRLWDPTTGKGK